MSNAINYVLARLCGRGAIDIPKRILETAFRDEWLDSRAPTSLENRIQPLITKRCFKDALRYVNRSSTTKPSQHVVDSVAHDFFLIVHESR
jgi:hypothetical protein